MADGSIIIDTKLDNEQAQRDLSKLRKEISSLESELAANAAKKSAIEEKLNRAKKAASETIDYIDYAQKELNKTTSETGGNDPFSAMWRDRISRANKELVSQDATVQNLGNQYTAITDKITAARDRLRDLTDQANEAASGLVRATQGADDLAHETETARNSVCAIPPAAEMADRKLKKIGDRIKGLAKRIFIFTLIAQALRNIKDYMWAAIKTNSSATEAVSRLKGALRTLAQPIVNILIPAFTVLANIITYVVNGAARLLSALFGTTFSASKKAAKSLYDQQNAISGVGDAAKKAGKSLAAFDEIQTVGGNPDSSGQSAAAGGIAPDFSGAVSDGLSAVATLFTGIALLALGAVITFSGANIPVGIAMMVAGALAVYGVASEDWNVIAGELQGSVGGILAIVAAGVLAIGAVLLFSGASIPLGLGLTLAGAGTLAATAAANWDTIQTALQGTVGGVVAILSGALLVLGAALLFSGASIPLGLGLTLAGAAGLAAAIAPNWNLLADKMRGPIGLITGIIGAALLVLGVILLFTGVGIPLGLGMIAIGGVTLAAAIAPNWNFITEKVRGAWESVKSFWKTHIAPVFTAEWWANLGKKIMNGLISGVESGINWVLRGVSDMVNGMTGILNKIPGVNIGQVNWGNVHIPRLAQGAVIPANREFLAVLGDQKSGTNIEAPLDTIKQAVAEVLGQGSDRPITIIVQMDGKEMFRQMVRENNSQVRMNGKSPLLV